MNGRKDNPIRFKFDPEKLAACVALLAQEKLPELTKLKVIKLLYYIDKHHLIRYGRQVINNAQVKKAEGTVKGSIIDIDTYIDNPKKDIIEIVEQGHKEEKKLFFTLLKEKFIKEKLNPEY